MVSPLSNAHAVDLDEGGGPIAAASSGLSGEVRLADWGVIRARGEDAAAFLQGQLTNDVVGIGPRQARLAGYCSPKGRLLASFVLWREAASGDILLACSADLLPQTLKRLSMFVLRAKCKLTDASGEVPLFGLAGGVVRDALGSSAPLQAWEAAGVAEGSHVVRLPDATLAGGTVPRFLCAGLLPNSLAQELPAMNLEVWNWLEARSGTARILAATVEQFVPQMVNLELVGGVSFQKGCYPGQEVVARSQYRGTLKRRAYLLTGATPMQPGQEIFHDADPGQPAGRIVLAGAWGGEQAALAELKIAAAETGVLHLATADGPRLALGSLPYPLPAEAG